MCVMRFWGSGLGSSFFLFSYRYGADTKTEATGRGCPASLSSSTVLLYTLQSFSPAVNFPLLSSSNNRMLCNRRFSACEESSQRLRVGFGLPDREIDGKKTRRHSSCNAMSRVGCKKREKCSTRDGIELRTAS